jgi:hypothetical protein
VRFLKGDLEEHPHRNGMLYSPGNRNFRAFGVRKMPFARGEVVENPGHGIRSLSQSEIKRTDGSGLWTATIPTRPRVSGESFKSVYYYIRQLRIKYLWP